VPARASETGAGRLERRLRRQASRAAQRRSPLSLGLLERAAADVAAGGPTWALLRERAGESPGDALPLRLLACVHRLVLAGEAPALARWYPSAGGQGTAEQAWPDFRALLAERAGTLRALLDEPLQTNEPGRAAGLLAGFLEVASATGLPLRVLEIGASAGLNLNWDRYRYRAAGFAFGPADSRVRLEGVYEGAPPAGPRRVAVASREGCDRRPLDVTSARDRLVLRSAVWADQLDRLALLDGALEIARRHPPVLARADAGAWLAERLAEPADGTATVVVHSIVMQYLPPAARARVRGLLEGAGREATPSRPLAWLRMEPPAREPREGDPARGLAELRLTRWPGGEERLLGLCGYHGRPVRLAELPR
jgi:hypothetical protein